MRPQDPFIGRSILDGQFEIVQKIGTGGMGAVYKASQPAMNRMVAIKILHPKLADRQDLTSRFRREARAMSQLTHPNTTKVFMYGELPEDESLYIVMEYLEGKNLNQRVRREGPLPVERAIPILAAVCEALDEAHQLGIVHRDMKPENIFLCNQGGLKDYPKVLDFGLAKVTERQMKPGSVILTQEGMVFGTPEFMSPEQAQGKTLDARSDIYSLAVILYEVLTGKLPFVARTPMEYIQKHVMEPPISLNQRVEGKQFPRRLEQVINKALAKNPDERYQVASDFARALQDSLEPAADEPEAPLPRDATGERAALAATQVAVPTSNNASQAAAAAKGPAGPLPVQEGAAQQLPATRPSGAPSAGLLIGVAAACLIFGVILAIVIMRLIIS
jgi:serine/threonine protein kinase